MRLLKSIELYREGVERPWRISLLVFPDMDMAIEMTCPAPDVEKVRCRALTRADYDQVAAMMIKAVKPDRINRSIERGWE
jgi:hypothetical protein